MPNLRSRRVQATAFVLTLAVVVQVPVVLAADELGVRPWMTLLAGALLSVPFLGQLLRSPWDHRPRSRAHKYLVMWPFYTWWTFCLVFMLSAAVLLPVAALTSVELRLALLAVIPVALVGTVRSLWTRPRVMRKTLAVANLPRAFEGLRIVQLSDIHCGPFAGRARIESWVRRANRLAADLAVVTGDLITTGTDHVDEMAAALSGLKAPLGVFACLGNHDHFGTGGVVGPTLERNGVAVLSNRGVLLRRLGAALYLAGIDDNWSGRDDLARALRDRPAAVPTVLLAHDPGMFPRAAAAGVDVTLSGHTHGGQLAVPWLVRRFNLARLVTPFSSGVYRAGKSTLFVNHGLGTSGPPIRLGARPELGLLTLVRAVDETRDSAREAVPLEADRRSRKTGG